VKTSGVESAVGRRYGRALFESARATGMTEEVGADLDSLRELIASEPGLRRYLLAPRVPETEKTDFLRRYLDGKVTDLTLRFLDLLLRKRRVGEFESMVTAYHHQLREERNLVEATVVTARPVGGQILADLRERLSRRTGKTVELDHRIEPELLGGMTVYLGGKVIDGSVRTRLRRLRDALLAARVH
jgi:F-type H+-transporting ATPase subunit delta